MPHFIVTGKDHDTGLVGTLACDAESQAAAASLAAGTWIMFSAINSLLGWSKKRRLAS